MISATLFFSLLLFQQDGSSLAAQAIEKTRTQESYHARFQAVIKMPKGDPYEITGESVWVYPGVLYIRYTGSGKDEKRIVRVGDKVWIYHEFLEDWVTAEEMGNGGAGRGVQNPEDILRVLQDHLENARLGDPSGSVTPITVPLSGKDIETIMKEQANQSSFNWKKSRASIVLLVEEGKVKGLQSAAALVSNDPNIEGQVVTYTAEVTVLSFNDKKRLSFEIKDEESGKTNPIPIPGYLEKAIKEFIGQKK
tara:strand:+ start:276 stop:1028 length:753 start_codon:yes stop_codon:yes gene_type:complete